MPDQNALPEFNLDAEIQRWCDRLVATSSDKHTGPNPEEMADHLHCQINDLIKSGLNPATAFVRATESLGDPTALRAELARASAPQFTRAQIIRFVAGYLAITLVASIVVVLTFGEQPYVEHLLAGIYVLLMPMLYCTARGRAAMQAECRMVKRLYRRIKT